MSIIIEKYIESGRHIEVQILGDNTGNVFHLFERECTIQRRYQKIIEETPSKILDKNIRKDIKFSIIDEYKFNGDLIEAQMFAYIGVRSVKKLILSSPYTTGVTKSLTGGKLYKFNDF